MYAMVNAVDRRILRTPTFVPRLVGGTLDGDRIAGKRRTRFHLYGLLAAGDGVAIAMGHLCAGWAYFGEIARAEAVTLCIVILPLFFLTALNNRSYAPEVLTNRRRSVWLALTALVVAFLVVMSVAFYLKASVVFSRYMFVAGFAASAGLMATWRVVLHHVAAARLGGSAFCEVLIRDDSVIPPGYVGPVVDAAVYRLSPRLDCPETLDRIGRLLGQLDRVIVVCPPDRREAWALALKGANVDVEVMAPELDGLGLLGAHSDLGSTALQVGCGPLDTRDRIVKRVFDLAVALTVIPLLLPAFGILAVLIKMDSPGPVFFKQDRIGRGNRLFKLYKFRSMRVTESNATASQLTAKQDTRVTRMGDFMRRTSIDELPQILNVLLGEMSIVGPRPHATGALAGSALYWEVDSRYWARHAIKPGMTGLAQVRGFRGTTFEQVDLSNRLQADLEYISGWSVWRDIAITLATFKVLTHDNAF